MEDYFRSFLEEFGDVEGEFGLALSQQLGRVGLDLDWLLAIAARGLAMQATPIPPILNSLYDGLFERCLTCEGELLAPPAEYLIVRMFRQEEPITEYAICTDCNDRLWESFSGETRARIEQGLRQHHGPDDDLPDGDETNDLADDVSDIERQIARCWMTGTPREECDTYQIVAHCVGTCLAPWSGVRMRSGTSLRETWQLWSRESRGTYDDFIEEFLGPTPVLKQDVPRPLPVGFPAM